MELLNYLANNNIKYVFLYEDENFEIKSNSSFPIDLSKFNTLFKELIKKKSIEEKPTQKKRRTQNEPSDYTFAEPSKFLPCSIEDIATPRYRKMIKLSSNADIERHITDCFIEIQQLGCKKIAKQFVKVFEPKKQTNHPYCQGEKKKPEWWPQGVLHKEPDHLHKTDRVKLLSHFMINCIENSSRYDIKLFKQSAEAIMGLSDRQRLILHEIFCLIEKKIYDKEKNSSFNIESNGLVEVSDFERFKTNSVKTNYEMTIGSILNRNEEREAEEAELYFKLINETMYI